MAQSAEQRRLIRLAHSMNRKARALRVIGHVTPEQLYAIVLTQSTCRYCGISLEIGQGTFDHVVSFDQGGRNDIRNIVRCCTTCNRKKFTKSPEELAEYEQLVLKCPVDGVPFRPRWSEWKSGKVKVCSRRCSALYRWGHRYEERRVDPA